MRASSSPEPLPILIRVVPGVWICPIVWMNFVERLKQQSGWWCGIFEILGSGAIPLGLESMSLVTLSRDVGVRKC